MHIALLPNEIILYIIYKLDYIDVLELYLVSKKFKNIIDIYLYSIYLSFEKNSSELYWHPSNDALFFSTSSHILLSNMRSDTSTSPDSSISHPIDSYKMSDWNNEFNYSIFSKIYSNNIRNKKKAAIIIKYIYKSLSLQLIVMGGYIGSMESATLQMAHIYLTMLYPNQKKNLNKTFCPYQNNVLEYYPHSHESLKKIIENYTENLLDYINIDRIIVDIFSPGVLAFRDPRILRYNKRFTGTRKYIVKINSLDTQLFKIY